MNINGLLLIIRQLIEKNQVGMVNQVLPKTDGLTGHSDNIFKINGDDYDIRSCSNRARRRRREEDEEEDNNNNNNNNNYGEPSFIKDRQADTILFYKN